MDGLLQALAGLVIGLSAGYFFGMVALGIRASHRARAELRAQAGVCYETPTADAGLPGADPSALGRFHLYYLVPCLNEAMVVGHTVSFLTDGPDDSTVIVVDDASDDATGAVARAAGGKRVTVVRRELPDARRGKGPALNRGFVELLRLVRERGQDPDRVIVVVMDADGRLSHGALSAVLPLFDDPAVGGAQLAVRIRNRCSWITRFQDFQFWTMSAMTQFGRIATSSVSLGGNGQFTRLSALLDIGVQPWEESLTEDLDLAIALMTRGWRCTTTPHASVDQQGVETAKRLLNQRTRWYQGHMTAGKRIPAIWRSTKIGHSTALEAVMYLLVPWVLDLPWSILYHLAIAYMVLKFASQGLPGGAHPVLGAVLVYVTAFYPAIVTAVLCRRRDPEMSWWRSIVLGHSFVLMNYLSWACCWRALYRMVRGRAGWEKTARTVETGAPAVAPTPVIPVLPRPVLPRPVVPMPLTPAAAAAVSAGPTSSWPPVRRSSVLRLGRTRLPAPSLTSAGLPGAAVGLVGPPTVPPSAARAKLSAVIAVAASEVDVAEPASSVQQWSDHLSIAPGSRRASGQRQRSVADLARPPPARRDVGHRCPSDRACGGGTGR